MHNQAYPKAISTDTSITKLNKTFTKTELPEQNVNGFDDNFLKFAC